MVSIDASQLNALAADLGAVGPRVGRLANQVIRKTALDVERDAKQLAPVDTGNLRNSIGSSVGIGGLSAEISPTAEYAVFVEYGTSRMAPQAFMGPALDRNTPSFVKAVEQLAREALGE